MSLLHKDDFIEMLLRGDRLETIAAYCGVKQGSIQRRIFRSIPVETRKHIMKVREEMGLTLSQ